MKHISKKYLLFFIVFLGLTFNNTTFAQFSSLDAMFSALNLKSGYGTMPGLSLPRGYMNHYSDPLLCGGTQCSAFSAAADGECDHYYNGIKACPFSNQVLIPKETQIKLCKAALKLEVYNLNHLNILPTNSMELAMLYNDLMLLEPSNPVWFYSVALYSMTQGVSDSTCNLAKANLNKAIALSSNNPTMQAKAKYYLNLVTQDQISYDRNQAEITAQQKRDAQYAAAHPYIMPAYPNHIAGWAAGIYNGNH